MADHPLFWMPAPDADGQKRQRRASHHLNRARWHAQQALTFLARGAAAHAPTAEALGALERAISRHGTTTAATTRGHTTGG